MFARDPSPPEGPAPAERLAALGLAPRSAGWVPDQPAAAPPPDEVLEPNAALPSEPQLAPPEGVPGEPRGTAIPPAVLDRLPLWAAEWVERSSPASLLAAGLAVVIVLLLAVSLLHHRGGSSPSYSSDSGTASSGSSSYSDSSPAPDPVSSADSDSIVVDVGGRVRKPGLVTLPAGARVADAIDAAGGPIHPRELDRIDLAQRVVDGQLLLVGVKTPASDPAASTTAGSADGSDGADPGTPISLSTATIEALETLPGVGPVTAQKIIDWRTAHGGFSSVEQLQQVSGIGPAHYAEISPLVTP